MTLRQRTRRGMGVLARKSLAKQRSNERHAREQRDAAIREIHSLSYTRKRKDGTRFLVPRHKEWRGKLRVAQAEAQAWAWLCRPYHGYPKPPRFDHEFPRVQRQRTKHAQVSAEIRNLEFWHDVLEARGEGEAVLERVTSHGAGSTSCSAMDSRASRRWVTRTSRSTDPSDCKPRQLSRRR